MVGNTTNGFKHFGWIGFICGAIALGITLIHFYTGPLVKEPSLKEVAAEKVVNLKDKALSMFKGIDDTKKPLSEKSLKTGLNVDEKLDLSAVILGFFALVFATIGFIRHENLRAAGMSGAFGVGAILFQFIGWAIAFTAVILIIGFTFFTLSRHKIKTDHD